MSPLDSNGRGVAARLRELLSSRRGIVVSSVVTVAILAVVIVTVAALSPPKSPSPEPPAGKVGGTDSTSLLRSAEDAARSGETSTAIAIARQVLKADPDNEAAKRLVRKLEDQQSAENPAADKTGSGDAKGDEPAPKDPGDNADDDAFSKPVKAVEKLLPTAFESYSFREVESSKDGASVGATPKTGRGAASSILWSIRDMGSAGDAVAFIKKTSKVLYDQDESTVRIDGAEAHAGTDGTRFANVAYVRGRYVFEVIVAGFGDDPEPLLPLAVSAAEEFADAPAK